VTGEKTSFPNQLVLVKQLKFLPFSVLTVNDREHQAHNYTNFYLVDSLLIQCIQEFINNEPKNVGMTLKVNNFGAT